MALPRPELFYTAKLTRSLTLGGSETEVYVNTLPTETTGYVVINPRSSTNREVVYYAGVSASPSNNLTGCVRGLALATATGTVTSEARVAANCVRHSAGEAVEMPPGHYEQRYVDVVNGLAPFGGNLDMGGFKMTDLDTPTSADDAATKNYVDSVVSGGAVTYSQQTVTGIAGETLSVDQLVYLKASDGRWWKTDADTASTVENVTLGITRGAGTAGVQITGGVTTSGEHTAASAIFTANTKYYASNTAGGFSTSAGTLEVSLGITRSTTVLLFNPLFDQKFTEVQRDTLISAVTTTSFVPTGAVFPFAGPTTPTGFLLADGTAVSRTTYSALFAILNPTLGTVTITIASPGVVTLTTHGLATGDGIYLTTTGALPTGLSQNTKYWVIKVDANTFRLATSLANALAGTAINTSGSQSGTHTSKQTPYGVGDGSTTFNVPNMKTLVPVGKDQADTSFAGLGQTGGAQTHTLTEAQMPAHTHLVSGSSLVSASGGNNPGPGSAQTASGSTGGGGAHNNLQPYLTLNYIIKT